MKKLIGIIFVMTITLLFITNSMYVEWTEIYIIIGSISVISVVYNLFLNHEKTYSKILSSSALIGFLLSLVFSLIDLGLDHYKVIQGVPDGRVLTFGETISEFSDDLFVIVLIAICSVTLISFIVTTVYSKFLRRIT